MAKSKFINYLAHEGIEKSVKGCVITPKKGIINFFSIENSTTHFTHFTGNAKIKLILNNIMISKKFVNISFTNFFCFLYFQILAYL